MPGQRREVVRAQSGRRGERFANGGVIENLTARVLAAARVNSHMDEGGDWENDSGFRVFTHGWNDRIAIPGGRGVNKPLTGDRVGL